MLWHVSSAFCPATNASLSSSLYDQPPHLLTSRERCLMYFQKDLKLGHTFSFCIFMLPHILFPHPYVLWIIPDLSRLISGIILSIMFTWYHLPFCPLWRNATHFVLSTFLVFKNSYGRNLSHCGYIPVNVVTFPSLHSRFWIPSGKRVSPFIFACQDLETVPGTD